MVHRLIALALLLAGLCLFTEPAAFTADTKTKPKPETDPKIKAMKAALVWIAANQRPDGSWETGMGDNRPAIVVATSFCGLCLLASEKPNPVQLNKAALYVTDNLFQDKSKVKFEDNWDQGNWKIAIGGLYLCEYYAWMKKKNPKYKNAQLQQIIERNVQESFKRMEESGGWGHTPRLKNPLGYVELEVVSNWMLTMLGSARKLGVKVPDDKLAKAFEFIENSCNEGKGAVGYSPREGQKGFGCPCRTGGAIFAFHLLGQEEHKLYPLMCAYWKKTMADSSEGHGSIALGMLASALAARQLGDDEWDSFKDKFFDQIVELATPKGSFKHIVGKTERAKGSDDKVGDAYNTAIYALILHLDLGNLSWDAKKK